MGWHLPETEQGRFSIELPYLNQQRERAVAIRSHQMPTPPHGLVRVLSQPPPLRVKERVREV
jgi:hypothetical protein